jgi:hypothetical protein
MELDRTRIVVRERSIFELLDLALKVTGTFFRELVIATSMFAVPFMMLNELLIGWMIADELTAQTIPTYLTTMSLLVFLEAPVATLGTTVFLGHMMFLEETDIKTTLRELKECLPHIIWTQLVLRGLLAAFALIVMLRNDEATPAWLFMVGVWAGVLRIARPYISEIVLLERNPFRSKDEKVATLSRRSRSLHDANLGDLIGRWVITVPVVVAMVVSLSLTFWFLQGVLSNSWNWTSMTTRVLVPVSLWCVVIYSAVLRFLCYLDLRCRREGWETELKVRAAAVELTR